MMLNMPELIGIANNLGEVNNLIRRFYRAPRRNQGVGSGPRRVIGSGIKQSNTGGRTKTLTKTKRKPKGKKINLVKTVKKLAKTAAIDRAYNTCTHREEHVNKFSMTHSVSNYGNNILALAKATDCEALLDGVKMFQPDSASLISADLTNSGKHTLVKVRFRYKFYMKNNDDFPVNLHIYDCVAVDDNNVNVQSMFDKIHTSMPAGNTTLTAHQQDVRHWFGDAHREMKDKWKLKNHTHVYLKPGDEYTFFITAKGFYNPSTYDAEAEPYVKGLTHNVWFRTVGVPCHSTSLTSDIGLTPLNQLDCVYWQYATAIYNGTGNVSSRANVGTSADLGDIKQFADPIINGIAVEQIAA